jgi:hypothetical protein
MRYKGKENPSAPSSLSHCVPHADSSLKYKGQRPLSLERDILLEPHVLLCLYT